MDERLRNALAGGTAGLVSAIITCPMDMVKLRLQNRTIAHKAKDVFIGIWRKEGLRGLYRGVYPTIAGYLPTWMIYFSVYDESKKYYNKKLQDTIVLSHILSALQAGLASTLLTNPIWVARTRIMTQPLLQSEQGPYFYRSTRHALSQIYHKEGLLALYKGLGPSIIGVSHVVVQFPTYERIKMKMFERYPTEPRLGILFASAVSKMIASTVTYPHEVVRTRLQTQSSIPTLQKYTGILQSIKVILAEEGIQGFYRGFGISLIRTVPSSALTILTFEMISNYIKDHY